MLKKAIRQGRSSEADPRFTVLGSEARTLHEKRRVLARRGRVGEKSDCFSILLEQITDQPDRLFRRGSGMDEMRRKILEQAHPGLVGPQQYYGLPCL